MRGMLISAAFLALACPARAGVYNLAEHHPFVPLDEARGYILRARAAALPTIGKLNPELFKAQVLRQAAELESQLTGGLFSTIDRVNLSGCYLRLGRARDAERLLRGADRQHFLVQSNLAAAYFLTGEPTMAIRHQETALALWPEVFAGWTEQQCRQFREAERYLLRLYKSREEETRRVLRGELDLDPLFPGLRLVGPEGEYAAGSLDPAIRDRLPMDAFNLLYQLVLWFPTDMRLYWFLGEILNLYGAIDQADAIFVELVETGALFKDLHRHRRVLKEALPAYRLFREPSTRGMLLTEMLLLPRPLFAPPGIGDAAYVASACAAIRFAPLVGKDEGQTPFAAPPQGLRGDAPAPLPFNFMHVAVGFGFGFLAAALLGFQLQEWRRRRLLAVAKQERGAGGSAPISPPGDFLPAGDSRTRPGG
jgi:tetratricopeptide (TPR) repeat protein